MATTGPGESPSCSRIRRDAVALETPGPKISIQIETPSSGEVVRMVVSPSIRRRTSSTRAADPSGWMARSWHFGVRGSEEAQGDANSR
jgi:hypothetical protein